MLVMLIITCFLLCSVVNSFVNSFPLTRSALKLFSFRFLSAQCLEWLSINNRVEIFQTFQNKFRTNLGWNPKRNNLFWIINKKSYKLGLFWSKTMTFCWNETTWTDQIYSKWFMSFAGYTWQLLSRLKI